MNFSKGQKRKTVPVKEAEQALRRCMQELRNLGFTSIFFSSEFKSN